MDGWGDGYDGYSDDYEVEVCPKFTWDGDPCTRHAYHGGPCR